MLKVRSFSIPIYEISELGGQTYYQFQLQIFYFFQQQSKLRNSHSFVPFGNMGIFFLLSNLYFFCYLLLGLYQIQMRYQVYFVSLFAYFTLHMMRMAIPFNQKPLADYYGLDNNMVGLANSLIYIVLGIAYMYRVIHPIKHVKSQYFYPIALACLFYILIPIYVYLGIKSITLLFISMAAFGLFQSTSWPVVLKLVDRYFNAQNDGLVLGIWSANADLGNLFGFFMCTAFVYFFNWAWQISLIFVSVSTFLVAFLLLKLPIDQTNEAQFRIDNHERGDVNVIVTLLRKMKNPQVLYLVFTLCLLKALLYGVLLWLPLYLDRGGFEEFTGYIPIGFSSLTIIGSVFFGLAYQMISKPILRNLMFMIINLVSVVAFWGIKITSLTRQNAWLIFFLVGVTGFCIPGKYNVQVAHETLLMCERYGIEIVIWSSLMESLGYIFVGIFQIIIGVSTSVNPDYIFVVFLVTNILGLVVEVAHFIYQRMRVRERQVEEFADEVEA